jgi:hypothetical protein
MMHEQRGLDAGLPARPSTLQITLWIGVIAVALLMTIVNWSLYQPGAHFDDARYIILARSLLGADHYGMENVPGAPAPGKYPFGFPLFLAPIIALWPQDLSALQIVSLVASLLISALLFWGWRWFKTGTSYWWALAVAALCTLSPMGTGNMRRIMSEPLFTLCCLVAIVLAEQWARGKRRWWWSTAMALALVLTIYTRTIGAVLIVCVLLYLFYTCGRAFWKPAVAVGLQAGVFIALVIALTSVQTRDLLPLEYLNDENARFFTAAPSAPAQPAGTAGGQAASPAPSSAPVIDAGRIFSRMGVILQFGIRQHFGSDVRSVAFPLGGGEDEAQVGRRFGVDNLPQITGYLVSLLVVLGFVRLLRRARVNLFLGFAVVYFAALFLWIWNDPRLLYPIQPQIFLAFLASMDGALKLAARPFQRAMPANNRLSYATVTALVAGALLFAVSFKSFRGEDTRQHVGDLSARTAWIKANTGAKDVIATNAPEIDYLYGDRKTVPHPQEAKTSDQLVQYFQSHGVRYVLLAPDVAWQPVHLPEYDEELLAMEQQLDAMVNEGEVTLAYHNADHRLKVYAYEAPDAAARSAMP